MGKKHKGLPQGMTYAQKLARDRMVKEAVEKAAVDDMAQIRMDIQTQRDLWLMISSLGDMGWGPKRIDDYFEVLQGNTESFNDMAEEHGLEYAVEKLRQKAEKASGKKIQYMYEKEMAAAKKRNEARGIFFKKVEDQIDGAELHSIDRKEIYAGRSISADG